jgi:hypothetical protein
VVFPQQAPPEAIIESNGYSLRVRPPSRATPATPSWPAETGPTPLLGSASLQHMKERRSTFRGLCLPAVFRPQGLVTLSTVSSLRTLAGFVSRRQRSWDSPFGAFPSQKASARFRTHGPTYRFTARLRRREAATQPVRPRFLGFDPPKSPWRSAALLARRPLDAPLGFAPSRVSQLEPCGGFRHHSSSALSPPPSPQAPRHQHPRVSISSGLAASKTTHECSAWTRQPSWGFCA